MTFYWPFFAKKTDNSFFNFDYVTDSQVRIIGLSFIAAGFALALLGITVFCGTSLGYKRGEGANRNKTLYRNKWESSQSYKQQFGRSKLNSKNQRTSINTRRELTEEDEENARELRKGKNAHHKHKEKNRGKRNDRYQETKKSRQRYQQEEDSEEEALNSDSSEEIRSYDEDSQRLKRFKANALRFDSIATRYEPAAEYRQRLSQKDTRHNKRRHRQMKKVTEDDNDSSRSAEISSDGQAVPIRWQETNSRRRLKTANNVSHYDETRIGSYEEKLHKSHEDWNERKKPKEGTLVTGRRQYFEMETKHPGMNIIITESEYEDEDEDDHCCYACKCSHMAHDRVNYNRDESVSPLPDYRYSEKPLSKALSWSSHKHVALPSKARLPYITDSDSSET